MRPNRLFSLLSLGLALSATAGCGDSPASSIAGPTRVAGPSANVAATSGAAGAVSTQMNAGFCLDVAGASTASGTPVILWNCNGASNQSFTLTDGGDVRVYGNLCLDASGGRGQNGDRIIAYECHGGTNQKWTRTDAGELRGINGKCIDLSDAILRGGAPIILYDCHGGVNQRWNLPTGAAVAPQATPPAPAPVAGGSEAAKVFALMGNVPSVAAIEAMGGAYARYERDFRSYGDMHWAAEGTSWESDYYDRAMIFYVWWARTGNQTYLDRANALVVSYRDNYLAPNNFNAVAHWVQPDGLALHYLLTGDERSRAAVGRMADYMAVPYYMEQIGNPDSYDIENRQQAKVLLSFVVADHIKAPSQRGNNWNALARDAVTKIMASQAWDGAYRWPGNNQCGYNKPFMVGLLNDAMVRYYTLIENDPRVIASVKKALDYMWANDWRTAYNGFVYLAGYCGGDGPGSAADLSNLLSSGFAFVWKTTGDDTYRARGDQVFAAGVAAAFLPASKQFNEAYTSSFRYLGLRF